MVSPGPYTASQVLGQSPDRSELDSSGGLSATLGGGFSGPKARTRGRRGPRGAGAAQGTEGCAVRPRPCPCPGGSAVLGPPPEPGAGFLKPEPRVTAGRWPVISPGRGVLLRVSREPGPGWSCVQSQSFAVDLTYELCTRVHAGGGTGGVIAGPHGDLFPVSCPEAATFGLRLVTFLLLSVTVCRTHAGHCSTYWFACSASGVQNDSR